MGRWVGRCGSRWEVGTKRERGGSVGDKEERNCDGGYESSKITYRIL